jgi:hypothetical protein
MKTKLAIILLVFLILSCSLARKNEFVEPDFSQMVEITRDKVPAEILKKSDAFAQKEKLTPQLYEFRYFENKYVYLIYYRPALLDANGQDRIVCGGVLRLYYSKDDYKQRGEFWED